MHAYMKPLYNLHVFTMINKEIYNNLMQNNAHILYENNSHIFSKLYLPGSVRNNVFIAVICSLTRSKSRCMRPADVNLSTRRSARACNLKIE